MQRRARGGRRRRRRRLRVRPSLPPRRRRDAAPGDRDVRAARRGRGRDVACRARVARRTCDAAPRRDARTRLRHGRAHHGRRPTVRDGRCGRSAERGGERALRAAGRARWPTASRRCATSVLVGRDHGLPGVGRRPCRGRPQPGRRGGRRVELVGDDGRSGSRRSPQPVRGGALPFAVHALVGWSRGPRRRRRGRRGEGERASGPART